MEYYLIATAFNPHDPDARAAMRSGHLRDWLERIEADKAFRSHILQRPSHDDNDKRMLQALDDQLERLESAVYIVQERFAQVGQEAQP